VKSDASPVHASVSLPKLNFVIFMVVFYQRGTSIVRASILGHRLSGPMSRRS